MLYTQLFSARQIFLEAKQILYTTNMQNITYASTANTGEKIPPATIESHRISYNLWQIRKGMAWNGRQTRWQWLAGWSKGQEWRRHQVGTSDPVWSCGSKARIQRFVSIASSLRSMARTGLQLLITRVISLLLRVSRILVSTVLSMYALHVSGWHNICFVSMATPPRHSVHRLATCHSGLTYSIGE